MKRNQMGREIKEKKKTGRERNRKHKRNKNGKKAEKKKKPRDSLCPSEDRRPIS